MMKTELNKTLLTVNEIYQSLQGESTWAGLRCVFVRLTGCHLRCGWCDTEYAFYEGRRMALDEILQRVREYPCQLVEITGGEPLLQANCSALAAALLSEGYTVLVETSGALPIDKLPAGVIRIMDLKCPGSGEAERNDWQNIERLNERDEVKFVLTGREDYDWAVGVVHEYHLEQRCRSVLFSPVFGKLEPRELAEWILQDHPPVRFQLQLHKLIWEPSARGV